MTFSLHGIGMLLPSLPGSSFLPSIVLRNLCICQGSSVLINLVQSEESSKLSFRIGLLFLAVPETNTVTT